MTLRAEDVAIDGASLQSVRDLAVRAYDVEVWTISFRVVGTLMIPDFEPVDVIRYRRPDIVQDGRLVFFEFEALDPVNMARGRDVLSGVD